MGHQDNTEAALELAKAGFKVFPCVPSGDGAKKPYSNVFWRSSASDDAKQIEAWWRMWPGAIPGIHLEKSGLIVIDVDCHEGKPDGRPVWAALCAEHGDPNAPSVRTPSGGQHYYFRQPAGARLGNHEGDLKGRGINVRGAGGFVIGPGCTLPDGRQYELTGDIGAAPVLPEWLQHIIAKPKEAQAKPSAAVPQAPIKNALAPGYDRQKRIAAYAEAGLAAELTELRTAPDGARNNTLNKVAFAVGTMIGAGWLSEGQCRQILLSAALEIGLGRAESLATIESGLKGGIASPRAALTDEQLSDIDQCAIAALCRMNDGTFYDAATGEIFDMPADAPPALEPAPSATDWLEPGGLIGEIADWIVETAPRRPNRPLAIGAAIAIVGLALSRTMAGPTRSGTHLYIACLGDSGIGKDWPMRAIALVLNACGLSMCAQAGKWKSDVALENGLGDMPAQIAIIDEIGQSLFQPIMGRKAGAHQAGIGNVLQTIWSASFATYQTSASAARRGVTINAPALSIFGASTINEFYASLAGAATENGFLNRFLLIKAAPRAKARRQGASSLSVPQSIIDGVQGLMRGGGNLEGGVMALCNARAPEFDIMPWADEAVHEAYEQFDESLIDRADSDPDAAHFIGRTAEMALRLATIHAASRAGRKARLDLCDWQWGRSVAEASADLMIGDVRSRMSQNDHQAKYNLMQRVIMDWQARTGEGILRSMLIKNLNGQMTKNETESVLSLLLEAGVVHREEKQPEGAGRPSVRYFCGLKRKEANHAV